MAARMKRILTAVLPVGTIGALEPLAAQGRDQGRIQEFVIELKLSVGISARSGPDPLLTFKEKSLEIRSLPRNLKAKRDFRLSHNNHSIPKTVELGLGRKGQSGQQNCRQQSECEAPRSAYLLGLHFT